MLHRRAKHYKDLNRKEFYKNRPLNLKTDKFSLAMHKVACLMESIYISREHRSSIWHIFFYRLDGMMMKWLSQINKSISNHFSLIPPLLFLIVQYQICAKSSVVWHFITLVQDYFVTKPFSRNCCQLWTWFSSVLYLIKTNFHISWYWNWFLTLLSL